MLEKRPTHIKRAPQKRYTYIYIYIFTTIGWFVYDTGKSFKKDPSI